MVSWVITGSNRGIGLGFIRKLSSDPNNIMFALTRSKTTSTALLVLESKQKNVHVLQADITDVASLREVATVVDNATGGTLDVLINNGAYLSPERGDWSLDMYEGNEDLLDEDCTNFFKVNALGVIKTINVFLPLLRKSAEKSLAKVITISAPAGDLDFNIKTDLYYFAPYALSKAAVNMVAAKYTARFKNENILFLSLSPGFVDTMGDHRGANDVQKATYSKLIEQFQAGYPDWDGKILTPEESVTAMLETVSKLTVKDSGAFISHYGDTKNWL
ncbi:hypothetical protein QCA50_016935 [Cerrena zonata]|uniref:Uncharacterized protein n=1 Tax=Cerrena zonata TaxID=2478898 RepID=A0AAW0FP15_9APHY